MNRRDFVLLARSLCMSKPTAPEFPSEAAEQDARWRQWTSTVDRVSRDLAEECAHFDAERFLREVGR